MYDVKAQNKAIGKRVLAMTSIAGEEDASNRNSTGVRFWPVMLAIFFGSFLSILGISTINIALPILMTDFGAGLNSVQWVLTGFMLSLGVAAPVTGYLGDRFGYKKVYLAAMIGFVAASALCALSWSMESLIAFRIVQGIFSGLVLPSTMTIIFQMLPRDKQPFAVSIWGLSGMLAPAFGPTISGWLIDRFNWHWLFYMNLPIGLIAILFIVWMIPNYRGSASQSLDKTGLASVVASSAMVLVALSQGRQWGWTSGRTLALFMAGFVILAVFIIREMRARQPLLNLNVFGNARFTFTLISGTITMIGLYAGTLLIPLFLQNVQMVSALSAGIVMLPASLIMALAMPVAGKLYPVIGPRWMTVGGLVLVIIGSLELSRLHIDTSHGYIILWMAVRNIGVSFAAAAVSTAGMEEIPPSLSGHGSSVTNWVRNVGGSFAIALFTSLLISRSASHAAALGAAGRQAKEAALQGYTSGVNDVFLISTIIAAAALPFGFIVGKRKPVPASDDLRQGAAESA